jgi:hypothetical protein
MNVADSEHVDETTALTMVHRNNRYIDETNGISSPLIIQKQSLRHAKLEAYSAFRVQITFSLCSENAVNIEQVSHPVIKVGKSGKKLEQTKQHTNM